MIGASAQHPAVPYDLGVNDYVRPVQDVQGQVFGPLAAVSTNISFHLAYTFN